jgi:hypothetical protein
MHNLEYYNTNSYVQLISKDTRALLCLQTSYAAARIDKRKKEEKLKYLNNKLCIFIKQP